MNGRIKNASWRQSQGKQDNDHFSKVLIMWILSTICVAIVSMIVVLAFGCLVAYIDEMLRGKMQ